MYKAYGKLINDKIHMIYVTHPICFKPHILSDKNVQFLGSQCHSQTSSVYGDIGPWILCTKSMGKIPQFAWNWAHWPFSDQMSVVGCRLALVPLFAFMVGCIIRSVRAYHLICQHDKLPLVCYLLFLFFSYSWSQSSIFFVFHRSCNPDIQ